MNTWTSTFIELREEQARLRRAGLWVRGRLDYLGILGQARSELVHSLMLAWLLDPIGSHGLGDRFLERFLARWYQPVPDCDPAEVQVSCEVPGLLCRADVVVSGPGWTVIIENKVDAIEGPLQCERLYQAFKGREEPRFVFLTPSDQAPTSLDTAEATKAWQQVSYRNLLADLRGVLDSAEPVGPQEVGASIVLDYCRTLEREFGTGALMSSLDDERVRFYLAHRDQIEEWAGLRKDAAAATKTLLVSFTDDLQELATDLGPGVNVCDRAESSNHIVLWSSAWPLNTNGYPLIGVGLGWQAQPLLRDKAVPWVGVRHSHDHERWNDLHDKFRTLVEEEGLKLPKDDTHWPAYQYVPAEGEYWQEEAIGRYRENVLEALVGAWQTYSTIIDRAVEDWSSYGPAPR